MCFSFTQFILIWIVLKTFNTIHNVSISTNLILILINNLDAMNPFFSEFIVFIFKAFPLTPVPVGVLCIIFSFSTPGMLLDEIPNRL